MYNAILERVVGHILGQPERMYKLEECELPGLIARGRDGAIKCCCVGGARSNIACNLLLQRLSAHLHVERIQRHF
jgi:hypothetical protein